jgi:hypothetical protein
MSPHDAQPPVPAIPDANLLACDAALTAAGRASRRARIRALARGYERERALRMLLPALCDRPLDPMRRLTARWVADDAATTRALMRVIAASLSAALWDRAHAPPAAARERRIDALRGALCAEAMRYRNQHGNEAACMAAPRWRNRG